MSAPRHTAGPWLAFERKHAAMLRPYLDYIKGANGCPVAEADGDSLDQMEANARLIAAAPDLLAACEAAMLACLPCAGEDERHAAWDAACKAIAKAKGETL